MTLHELNARIKPGYKVRRELNGVSNAFRLMKRSQGMWLNTGFVVVCYEGQKQSALSAMMAAATMMALLERGKK